MTTPGDLLPEYDYVIVGSGAGGGPLAANLAEHGHSVLLLEAGDDYEHINNPKTTAAYEVPVFHARSTEDPNLCWNYYVQHYTDPARQSQDTKFVQEKGGILYPRAGTVGGCTAHHALITVYPHGHDWDRIAQITGDPSWSRDQMRQYFQRLEDCRYLDRPDNPEDAGQNPGRHGFGGWLPTQGIDPRLALQDRELLEVIVAAVADALEEHTASLFGLLRGLLAALLAFFRHRKHPLQELERWIDPNDWEVERDTPEGLCMVPITTDNRRRFGARDRIRGAQTKHPDRLTVLTHALATRVLFEGTRAVGVEYLAGRHLYQADPLAAQSGEPTGETHQIRARREVILAAGSFNTPQLLMLSGVGPKDELEKFRIPVLVDLPGVGANLQDRYEIGVISEMKEPFSLLRDCRFVPPTSDAEAQLDPCYIDWTNRREGLYSTNGAVLGIIKRSQVARRAGLDPDLFIFGLPAYFKGYCPRYSERLEEHKNFFTWVILKAHTRNASGRVTLASKDPRAMPCINFRSFDDTGEEAGKDDLEALLDGVQFVRRIGRRMQRITKEEALPGKQCATLGQLREFIKREAWGHHACGTCKIGPKEDQGVVDSQFRVHGTQRLRVVDASVFPYIPGFFILLPVYMISEKASDVILSDAAAHT